VLHQSLDVIEDFLSQAAFDRAAKWLSYCLEHDDECKNLHSDFMPRRLLNVGSSVGSCDPFLFEPVEPAPYVCLSYCWGPDVHDVLKTTKANLDSHYRAVPYASLPLTIRDAVIVCRRLQISNLWVDSLCIVQDDKTSWLQDSAQMHDIYLNSHFTIAAQEPASCKSGFLGKQRFGDPEWQRRFVTDIPAVAGGPANEIFIRRNDQYSEEVKERFSLDKRGWCLQESLLPKRKLCFNGNEMSWECHRRRICECGHSLWVPQTVYGQLGASIKSATLVPARGSRWGKPHAPGKRYEDWRALVEEYSDRCLSQTTDKLSAISGLAKTIAHVQREEGRASDIYLAGLWKGEFLFDLTWRVVTSESEPQALARHDRRSPYRAPSWSWASVDRSVRYEFWKSVSKWKYRPDKEDDCTIDDVVCHNLLPDDPTSPVTVAHAVLTGPLVSVELAVLEAALYGDHGKPKSLVRSQNLHTVEVFLDEPLQPTLRQGDAQVACWGQGKCETQCCVWRSHQHPATKSNVEEENHSLYCFRLFTWTGDTGKIHMVSGRWRPMIMGPESWFLLLRKSSRIEDAFERIGVGTWAPKGNSEDCPLFEKSESVTVKVV